MDRDHRSKKRPATSQPARDSKKRHLNTEKPKRRPLPITVTTAPAVDDVQSSDEESHITDVDNQSETQEATTLVAKSGNGAGSFFPGFSGASSLSYRV
jgi:hypothetical protein